MIFHEPVLLSCMNLILHFAIGAALSQLVLSIILLLSGRLGGLSRNLYGLLMFAILGYLLIPLFRDWAGIWVLGAVSTLAPGAFWLFCDSLFDDHYEFPLWQPVLVGLSVLMPTLFLQLPQLSGSFLERLLVDLPQMMEFVFLALAFRAVFHNWRDDLMSTRRTLRLWFCGISGLFIFTLLLSRELLFPDEPWLDFAQYLATAIVLTGTNALLMRFEPGVLDPIQRKKETDSSEPAEDPAKQLAPITRLVEEEGIYREHSLTIGKLATAAAIPEYRLRQLINSGLGYRNFNDFLNSFRIKEASRRLIDPAEAQLPVLTIALDVGFLSISSFNKSFKDTHAMTPTAWRKQHSA